MRPLELSTRDLRLVRRVMRLLSHRGSRPSAHCSLVTLSRLHSRISVVSSVS